MKSAIRKPNSWSALGDFMTYWQDQNVWKWSGANIVIADIDIIYTMRGLDRTVTTQGFFYHSTKIELANQEWLNSIDHYTGFDGEYQQYKYIKPHVLEITGDGPKFPEGYRVQIAPAGKGILFPND